MIALIYFHIAEEKIEIEHGGGDSFKVNEVTLSLRLGLPASKPLSSEISPTFPVISATHQELQLTNQLLNDGRTILVFLKRWKAMVFIWRFKWEKCSINRVIEGMDSKMLYRQSLHRQLQPSAEAEPALWCQSCSVEITVIKTNTQNRQQTQTYAWVKTEQCAYPPIRGCNWIKCFFKKLINFLIEV